MTHLLLNENKWLHFSRDGKKLQILINKKLNWPCDELFLVFKDLLWKKIIFTYNFRNCFKWECLVFHKKWSFLNAKFNLKLLCKIYSWYSVRVKANKQNVAFQTSESTYKLVYSPASELLKANQHFTQTSTAWPILMGDTQKGNKYQIMILLNESSTWHLNDLHSVQQGRWNSRSGVGSGYKENLGKVKGHI